MSWFLQIKLLNSPLCADFVPLSVLLWIMESVPEEQVMRDTEEHKQKEVFKKGEERLLNLNVKEDPENTEYLFKKTHGNKQKPVDRF